MEAKFVTGRDEFPLDFYTSMFVRDAALVCATLSEGEGGNDLDWNKMSPLCNILKSNLALGGLRVQHYSKYRIYSICSTDCGARRISSFSKMPMMSFCTLNSEKKTIYETVISGYFSLEEMKWESDIPYFFLPCNMQFNATTAE